MLKQNQQWWQKLSEEKLWYFVGLLTSDGSLSKDGRHIDLTSKDEDFLNLIKEEFNLPHKIGHKTNGRGLSAYRIQMGSIRFYDFLISIGLMPNKSKALQAIAVPQHCFFDFVRGVFDGDGCIREWVSKNKSQKQVYCKITSGSKKFLIWLQDVLQNSHDIFSSIHEEYYSTGTGFVLKISRKKCVKKFLECCYSKSQLSLQRKRESAFHCLAEL